MQRNILDYLDGPCRDVPDKIAFSDGTSHLAFREIRALVDSVGAYLVRHGICREPVVVFMGKHPHTIAAFLGIVRGGCYYVPIDASMPPDRINRILANLDARMMICDEHTFVMAAGLAFTGLVTPFRDICHTEMNETIAFRLNEIAARTIDTDPVYIVHTSGSTGVPKGVVCCHRSVIDYIEQLSAALGFGPATVFGNQSPLYFDACLKEIYPTLKYGATTYLIPGELFMQPVRLVEYLNEHRINTICWVASAMAYLSSLGTFDTILPQYLTKVNFGSEIFPLREFARWRAALPGARFFNLYGPTECTGMSCYYEATGLPPDAAAIPIGRPFANTGVIILSDEDKRAAIGERGEICIRGTALALGYYNDFAKTGAVFVQNPLNRHYPEAIYRTGDIGYLGDDGELYYCSRIDHQIKHMGYRIELGDIEHGALTIDGVRMACCVHDPEKSKIRLFYVGEAKTKEVAARLRQLLPRYMMPGSIKQLAQLPVTANGKIDRNMLKGISVNSAKQITAHNTPDTTPRTAPPPP